VLKMMYVGMVMMDGIMLVAVAGTESELGNARYPPDGVVCW